jgi:integrase/recombinase XerD
MHPLPDGAHAVGAPLRPPSGRPPLRAHRVTRASLNPVPRRPLTESLIDPPYHPHIQHERVETTQIYLHADLALKEKALARTKPPDAKPGRYRPPDTLLAFLEAL